MVDADIFVSHLNVWKGGFAKETIDSSLGAGWMVLLPYFEDGEYYYKAEVCLNEKGKPNGCYKLDGRPFWASSLAQMYHYIDRSEREMGLNSICFYITQNGEMIERLTIPKPRYNVRFFVDDDVTEEHWFQTPKEALDCAVEWNFTGIYETDETPDYVEVLRDEGSYYESLLWLNDNGDCGVELNDDSDPDYAISEEYSKKG